MEVIKFLVIFLAFLNAICATNPYKIQQRTKRFLPFPINTDIGMTIAYIIPLDNPYRSAFVEHELMEANFNVVQAWTDYVPGPLVRLDLVDGDLRAMGRKNYENYPNSVTEPYNKTLVREMEAKTFQQKEENTKISTEKTTTNIPKVTRSQKSSYKMDANDAIITRKKVYKILQDKLKSFGHLGKACLLRAICEEAEEPIHPHNGLIGDIVHIVLTPSTSDPEDIHPEYYKAEELGLLGDCSKYKKYCTKSIIEYISEMIEF